MSVKIRLTRTGRRNRACFRLVAIESRNARDGRVLENLGLYDPVAARVDDQLRLHGERIIEWVKNGAILSETAASLCERSGIEIPKSEKKRKPRKRKPSAERTQKREARDRAIYKAKKERRDARVAAKKAAAAESESSDES
jgi:small subunit ribosomal protein S16